MLAALLRSPAVVETFLFLMLLSWFGGSAVMLLLTGQRTPERDERTQDAQTQPRLPAVARAVTGAPRR